MEMNNNDMLFLAKKVVLDKYKDAELKTTDGEDYTLTERDVFIVWFSKTVQNWKAMVSTIVNDGLYYEVTYNGDTNQLYLDSYKLENSESFDVKRNEGPQETQEGTGSMTQESEEEPTALNTVS